MAKKGPVRTFLKPMWKYAPSVIWPGIFFGLIYWDWNRTREWKEKQKSLEMQH